MTSCTLPTQGAVVSPSAPAGPRPTARPTPQALATQARTLLASAPLPEADVWRRQADAAPARLSSALRADASALRVARAEEAYRTTLGGLQDALRSWSAAQRAVSARRADLQGLPRMAARAATEAVGLVGDPGSSRALALAVAAIERSEDGGQALLDAADAVAGALTDTLVAAYAPGLTEALRSAQGTRDAAQRAVAVAQRALRTARLAIVAELPYLGEADRRRLVVRYGLGSRPPVAAGSRRGRGSRP